MKLMIIRRTRMVRKRLARERCEHRGLSYISRSRTLGISRKYAKLHAAERQRPDVAAASAASREVQTSLDPRKLVFIYESGASTNMTPRYGRCEKGERLFARAPFGHWKTTTFAAALRHGGLTAPCVCDSPINGEEFDAYAEQVHAPTSRPGHIGVMDNFDSRKVAGVRQTIEVAAERKFLPVTRP